MVTIAVPVRNGYCNHTYCNHTSGTSGVCGKILLRVTICDCRRYTRLCGHTDTGCLCVKPSTPSSFASLIRNGHQTGEHFALRVGTVANNDDAIYPVNIV